jgi:hypothetical protein
VNIGISLPMGGEEFPGTDGGTGFADLGYMRHLSAKSALGVSLAGISSTDANRVGVRGRYRYWISRVVGLDATAGLVVAGGGDLYETITLPGLLASVGVQAWGVVGFTVEMEETRWSYGGSTTQWRIGGHLGSELGVAGAAVLGVIVAVWAASWD